MDRFVKLIVWWLLPNFTYEFVVDMPISNYIENAAMAIKAAGGTLIERHDNDLCFYVPSRRVLLYSLGGRLKVTLRKDGDRHKFSVEFQTVRFGHYIVASVISIVFIFEAFWEGALQHLRIVPVAFISGHLLFLGMLPSKIERIQRFLVLLGETKTTTGARRIKGRA